MGHVLTRGRALPPLLLRHPPTHLSVRPPTPPHTHVAQRVRVPRIHWEATSRRVLTMEWVEGIKLTDKEGE